MTETKRFHIYGDSLWLFGEEAVTPGEAGTYWIPDQLLLARKRRDPRAQWPYETTLDVAALLQLGSWGQVPDEDIVEFE